MELLSSIIITKIATILRNESEILNNLVMIADILEVSTDVKITSCIVNKNKTGYECIKNILSDWVARVGSEATLSCLTDKFHEMGFVSAAEILRSLDCSTKGTRQEPQKYRRINVLKPVPNFSGREEELCKIKAWYDSGTKNPVFVISAMGGQGKTELVRKFIDVHHQTRHCVWLSGDGLQALVNSLQDLMSEIRSIQAKNEQSVKKLCDGLFKSGKMDWNDWLLIVDNVDSVFEEFEEFLCKATTHGAIFIVTGRPLDIFPGECEHLRLESLTMGDAKELVSKYLGCEFEEDSDVVNICNILGCHALALAQTATYIKAQRQIRNSVYSIIDYIREFSTQKLEHPTKLQNNMYDKTFCKVFSLSLKAAKSQHGLCGKCVEIALVILALVGRDGLRRSSFLDLFFTVSHQTEVQDDKVVQTCPLQAEEAVAALSVKVSLVRQDRGHLSAHRLIQTVTLDLIEWTVFAGSILEHLSNVPVERRNISTTLALKSIWLNLKPNSLIVKHKMFPVYIAAYDHFFLDGTFVRQCVEKALKIMESNDESIHSLKFLFNYTEWRFNDDPLYLSRFCQSSQDIKNLNSIGRYVDLVVVTKFLFTEYSFSSYRNFHEKNDSILLVLEKNARFIFEKEANPIKKLKAKLIFATILFCRNKPMEPVLHSHDSAENATLAFTKDELLAIFNVVLFRLSKNKKTDTRYGEILTKLVFQYFIRHNCDSELLKAATAVFIKLHGFEQVMETLVQLNLKETVTRPY